MTHGHVSTSQTLIYPLLPLSSQSIFVFLKKTTKKQNKNWLGTTTKPAKRAMQTTHAWGLLSSRLGNNDVKKSGRMGVLMWDVKECKRHLRTSFS